MRALFGRVRKKVDRRQQAIEALMSTDQHEFPVVDGLSKPVGILTREDILAALPNHDRSAPVASFMRSARAPQRLRRLCSNGLKAL
jgi:CBS domain-containing protein